MKRIVYLVKETNHYVTESREYPWNDMMDTLYGYTFLFDPFILAATGRIPEMRSLQNVKDWSSIDLFISPLAQDLVDAKMERGLLAGLERLGRQGKAAVLVQPSRRFYRELPPLRKLRHVRDIPSMCEEWRIDLPGCRHRQNYPQRRIFQAVEGAGEVLSTVGEWPALILKERLALFTVDPMRTFARFCRGNVTWKHANLWVVLVRRLLGMPDLTPEEAEAEIDLRRDFHAFGYALVMLKELADLQGKRLERHFEAAVQKLLGAANAFVDQHYSAAQAALKAAFQELHRGRLEITRMEVHLVDSLHGSTLYPDASFAELEWPEELARYMDLFFDLMRKRNYRMNLDWDVRSIESLANRCPQLTDRMRQFLKAGQLEFINGGYTQHYPHYWSVNASIQNLKYGRRAFERIYGQPVVTYGGQECCVNPQMPNLLAKSGYRHVLHRIQNFGHVPLVKEAAMRWRGKDGSVIAAVAGNPTATERLGVIFYLLLAYKIHQSIQNGIKDPVLTNLMDLGVVAFREEVCRIAWYAPIFGRHTTVSEYFRTTRPQRPLRSFDYYDYLYGYFYRTPRWRGNENDSFIKAFALEQATADAQLLNGIAVFQGRQKNRDFWPQWDLLFALHAHDALIAGNVFTGAFFGGGGPIDVSMTNASKPRLTYPQVLEKVRRGAAKDLKAVMGRPGKQVALFNTLGFEREALVQVGKQQFARVRVPSYGWAPASMAGDGRVNVSDQLLENEHLRIRFNPVTGAIAKIIDRATGRAAVGRCNELVYGGESVMHMDRFQILENSSWRAGVRISGTISTGKHLVARYETEVALADRSRVVDIRTRLRPAIKIPSNPCDHALRMSVQTASSHPQVITSYLNASETLREPSVAKQYWKFKPKVYPLYLSPSDSRLRMFDSPNYERIRSNGSTVDLFNDGAQWYYQKDGRILQHLVGENDTCLDFHYGIAVNRTDYHPLLAALDWQTPVRIATTSTRTTWSLFQSDSPTLLLFGCEHLGNRTFILRAMELAGRKIRTEIASHEPVRQVVETDYQGNALRTLKARKDGFTAELPAWGITEFRVQFHPKPSSNKSGTMSRGAALREYLRKHSYAHIPSRSRDRGPNLEPDI